MYKTTRHTLRAGRDSRRSTLKQQRGGGITLQSLCKWRGVEIKDTKWQELLNGTDYAFLLDEKWINNEETAINNYIKLVEHQDELFMLSVKAIFAELKIDTNNEEELIKEYSNIEKDTEKQDSVINYFKDIYYILQLTPPTPATKCYKLLSEKLITLLVNPLRVKNHFINNLATTILHIANTDKLEKLDNKEYLIDIFATQLNSYTKANTLAATSEDLRDGPYLNSLTTNAHAIINKNEFWKKVLLRCLNIDKFEGENVTKFSGDPITFFNNFNTHSIGISGNFDGIVAITTIISFLSAIIILKIKEKKDSLDTIRDYILSKLMTGGDVFNVQNYKSYISIDTIRFVYHLIYTIKTLSVGQTNLPENKELATATTQ